MTRIYFNIYQAAQCKTHSPPRLFVWPIFPSLSRSRVLMWPQNRRSTEEWAVGQLYFCRPCTCFGCGAKGVRRGERPVSFALQHQRLATVVGQRAVLTRVPDLPIHLLSSHQLLCCHFGCFSPDFFHMTFLPFSHLPHFSLSLLLL